MALCITSLRHLVLPSGKVENFGMLIGAAVGLACFLQVPYSN